MTAREIDGYTVFTVAPRTGRATSGVLYLHGGAYVAGIARQHWALVSRMVDAGLRVDVPDYGLAPHHTYGDAYPFVLQAYGDLRHRMDGGAVHLIGDSAGGGLALGLAQALVAADTTGPDLLILIAPWLDLALGNPDIAMIDDPWLSRASLIEFGKAWAGGAPVNQPRLSPIHGSPLGLPPVHVYAGTRDLLFPDIALWAERAHASGVDVSLRVCVGGVHVYPLVPAPEGRAAAREIVSLLAGGSAAASV